MTDTLSMQCVTQRLDGCLVGLPPGGRVTRPIWEQLDPLALNDGVFYVPAMVELQPRLALWGHPDLRERLANDRPHGAGGEKLLCLLCMRHQAQRGLPAHRSG